MELTSEILDEILYSGATVICKFPIGFTMRRLPIVYRENNNEDNGIEILDYTVVSLSFSFSDVYRRTLECCYDNETMSWSGFDESDINTKFIILQLAESIKVKINNSTSNKHSGVSMSKKFVLVLRERSVFYYDNIRNLILYIRGERQLFSQ